MRVSRRGKRGNRQLGPGEDLDRLLLIFLGVSLFFHLGIILFGLSWNAEIEEETPPPPIRCRLSLPPPPPVPVLRTDKKATLPEPPVDVVPEVRKKEEIEEPRPAPVPEQPSALEEFLTRLAPTPEPGAVLEKYTNVLWREIYRQRTYPREAAILGWEGNVAVVFTLSRTGHLESLHIPAEGSSGMEIFNQEALRAVRAASEHFPPFPEQLTGQSLSFSLLITFTAESAPED